MGTMIVKSSVKQHRGFLGQFSIMLRLLILLMALVNALPIPKFNHIGTLWPLFNVTFMLRLLRLLLLLMLLMLLMPLVTALPSRDFSHVGTPSDLWHIAQSILKRFNPAMVAVE